MPTYPTYPIHPSFPTTYREGMTDQADLIVYQGNDYACAIEVTSSDTSIPPEQLLIGYTAQAQIREGIADLVPQVTQEITTNIQSPYVYCYISSGDTTKLTSAFLVWDIKLISPDGIVTTILCGKVIVQRMVTV